MADLTPTEIAIDLNDAERQLIAATLRGRGAPRVCESCGTDNWQVGSTLVTPISVARGAAGVAASLYGPIHTSALLLCTNCGNTKLYNVGMLGLTSLLKGRGT